MKTLTRFVFCHILDIGNMFLIMGVLTSLLSTCETEYIPDIPDDGIANVFAEEGNFSLDIRFANFGEVDSLPDAHSMELKSDTLSSTHSMEPETDVIRVDDDMYIFATLSVDPVDRTPAVTTRKFVLNARIRIVAYRVDLESCFTYVYDTLYYVNNLGTLIRDGSTNKINLPAGKYKLVAYSFNNSTDVPTAYLPTISCIDPGNDLIWGESDTTTVYDGGITNIPIKMYHKLSQVKLAATTGPGGTKISAFTDVTMPGYTVNMTTLNGSLAKNTAISQPFTFSTLNVDTIRSNTRTVYTGTPGDMPTVIHIGSMTVGTKTLPDISAAFAKSLQSGYSYTMTMKVGVSTEITDNVPYGLIPYVGAFWKAGQTGERLIRMPRMSNGTIDGVWTAQVIQGKDWIRLDTVMTKDLNVGWRTDVTPNEANVENGNSPGFETNLARQLSTVSTFVSGVVSTSAGKDQIYFRIGANSKYTPTPTEPARYGMLLLTYGNNTYRHRIWIRQGEDPDFLMRPENPSNSTGFTRTTRPKARKFSPYNLTAATLNQSVDIPGNRVVNPGKFTNYPSQAGAFFQWANDNYPRYAWSPVTPGITGTASLWNAYASGLWTDILNTHESCPPSFRRPTDGATNVTVSFPLSASNMDLSEMRQSLYILPQDGINNNSVNTIWGYYADGFFDRRAINVTSGYDKTTVSTGNDSVAYVGRLFYNPTNFASLFFPATGIRASNGGALSSTGESSKYWSSSYTSGTDGWDLTISNSLVSQLNDTRSYGHPIRCVQRPDATVLCMQNSTEGKEFFVSFGQNFGYANPRLELRIASTVSTTITLTFTQTGATTTYPVIANDVLHIDLAAVNFGGQDIRNMTNQVYYDAQSVTPPHQVVGSLALKITSPDPISVYAFNTGDATTDATILLPVTAWGKEYYRLSYLPVPNYADIEIIIANQDATHVYLNGSTLLTTLNAGQVFFNLSGTDWTGRRVTSDKPVAYFTHTSISYVPVGRNYGDILFEQLAPVSQWGYRFLVPNAPQNNNTSNNRIRVIASQPNTRITFTGATVTTTDQTGAPIPGVTNIAATNGILQQGQWTELLINRINPAADACYIEADQPVGVAAYMVGSGAAGSASNVDGDPSICWIPSVDKQMVQDQIISPFMFAPGTPNTLLDSIGFNTHYMIIITPTATANQTTVNGVPITSGWVNNASGFSHYVWYFTSPTATTLGDLNRSFRIKNSNGIIVLAGGLGKNESYYYNAGSGTCTVVEN